MFALAKASTSGMWGQDGQSRTLDQGLTTVTQGWFVGTVRDAEWRFSERRGAICP